MYFESGICLSKTLEGSDLPLLLRSFETSRIFALIFPVPSWVPEGSHGDYRSRGGLVKRNLYPKLRYRRCKDRSLYISTPLKTGLVSHILALIAWGSAPSS